MSISFSFHHVKIMLRLLLLFSLWAPLSCAQASYCDGTPLRVRYTYYPNGFFEQWWACVELDTGKYLPLSQINNYNNYNFDNVVAGSNSTLYCADGSVDAYGYSPASAYQRGDTGREIQVQKIDGYNPAFVCAVWNPAAEQIIATLTDTYEYNNFWLANVQPSNGEPQVLCQTTYTKLGWGEQRAGISAINANATNWWTVVFLQGTKGTRLARFPLTGSGKCQPVYTSLENLYDLFTIIWDEEDGTLIAVGQSQAMQSQPTMVLQHGEGESATWEELYQWDGSKYRLKNSNSAAYSQGVMYTLLVGQAVTYDYLSIFQVAKRTETNFMKISQGGKSAVGLVAGFPIQNLETAGGFNSSSIVK